MSLLIAATLGVDRDGIRPGKEQKYRKRCDSKLERWMLWYPRPRPILIYEAGRSEVEAARPVSVNKVRQDSRASAQNTKSAF